jgi:hypothetical protein
VSRRVVTTKNQTRYILRKIQDGVEREQQSCSRVGQTHGCLCCSTGAISCSVGDLCKKPKSHGGRHLCCHVRSESGSDRSPTISHQSNTRHAGGSSLCKLPPALMWGHGSGSPSWSSSMPSARRHGTSEPKTNRNSTAPATAR